MAEWFESIWSQALVADATKIQYASGLRYWDAWHRLRYGSPLPLGLRPPALVPPATLEDFISDHMAIAQGGRLQMRMPPRILAGLQEAQLVRAAAVSPRTTNWRLDVLGKAHTLLGLPFDRAQIRSRQAEIAAVYESEKAALGTPTSVPMSAKSIVQTLVAACTDDREGIQDAALIHFLCRLKPDDVARIRFKDLVPGHLKVDPDVDIVALLLDEPAAGPLTFRSQLHFIGEEATDIKFWGAIREDEASGDDLFFVHLTRSGELVPLNALRIARRLKLLARRAGLADVRSNRACSPTGLRKAFEREHHESLPLTKVARAARVSLRSAKLLTRGMKPGNR